MAAVAPATTEPTTSTTSSSAPGTTGRQIPIVCPGHTRPLAELQFCTIDENDSDNTDGNNATRTFLVSACHDKMPMLRSATTGDWIGTFSGHKGAVWSCRLDPKALLAGTASGDFSVRVWDAIKGQSLYVFPHKHVVKTCDWSGDSRRLATGGHEGILRVFDITEPEKDPLMFVQSTKEKVSISKCNWIDKSTVLAAGEDGTIRFWNVDESDPTKQLVSTLSVDSDDGGIRDMEITNLTTTPPQTVLTVAAGQNVTFFDLTTRRKIHSYKMPIHFGEEGGASLHPSGKKFIAGGGRKGGSMALKSSANKGSELGSDLKVYVFDFDTGKELECHKGHHGPVRCLRYHPDGKSYATGSEDGTIRVWKTDP
eukprot:CAMPEP_0183707126 /NCGR_PEP_ID=MMETSP0737-20130205/3773_1 /TAXON_ID=385413 /ORGANISM="Thalassiosira miniscula, Strain CCMP1093" /LENGTH=367 /DNA_ID=CAMNT_0025934707 /DNA_START=30 /DNA_END=1133 /DNA_ORIENTATION=-